MGGISDAIGGIANTGLGMVSGGLAGPLMGRFMNSSSSVGGAAPAQAVQQQIPQRSMPAAYNNPWMQQFIAQQQAGGQGQGGMPMGMNVTPLAMRQQMPQMQRPMAAPTWNVNSMNPYQNMARQQQAQPAQYQNMGMFGAYNPYMPRR